MKRLSKIIVISICVIVVILALLFFRWRSSGDSPAGDLTWRLTESTDRPDCLADESEVNIMVTDTGISFGRAL
jgi:hypothetical protein